MATRKARDEEEKKPKTEAPEAEEKLSASDDAVVELEVGDPAAEEEEDDEDDSTEVVQEARPSRQDKKRARRNEFEETRARAAALEAENQRMRQEWAQYQQAQQAQQYQQQTQQQVSQEEARYRDDLKTFYQALESQRATATAEQMAEFERKAMELKEREFRIFSAKHGMGQQIDPRQIEARIELAQVEAKYADIYANQAARYWGEGRLRQLAAEAGGVRDKAHLYLLLEQAADDTRRQFRMNGHGNPHATRRPAPDAATKARFSGVSARASGGGAGETVRVTIGKAQRQLARGAFPEDTEEVAIQKWARGPGRRAALAAQKSR